MQNSHVDIKCTCVLNCCASVWRHTPCRSLVNDPASLRFRDYRFTLRVPPLGTKCWPEPWTAHWYLHHQRFSASSSAHKNTEAREPSWVHAVNARVCNAAHTLSNHRTATYIGHVSRDVSLQDVILTAPVSSGYGFVDFDSPAAAQKAVTALKSTGIQAQMAKVRIHGTVIPISPPPHSPFALQSWIVVIWLIQASLDLFLLLWVAG